MLVLSGPFELAAVWMLKRRLRYKTARLVVGMKDHQGCYFPPPVVDRQPSLLGKTKR